MQIYCGNCDSFIEVEELDADIKSIKCTECAYMITDLPTYESEWCIFCCKDETSEYEHNVHWIDGSWICDNCGTIL